MNHSDDGEKLSAKLSTFLKNNIPEVPARKPDELARLMRKLDLEEQPIIFKKKVWIAFSGAVAAGVLAFWVAVQKAPQPQYLAGITIEVMELEEDLPSLEIGEDYLSLASFE